MTSTSDEQGVLAVLIDRMETQRLPRALALKEKVDQGQILDDFDLSFLEEVFADSVSIKSLLARHPEYQDLAGKVATLYREITEKALDNQRQGPAA
jgi:hypothetical protein